MEFSEAGHEIKYFGFRRVVTGVIFLGRLDDDVDHVREAATAAAPFPHGVVYLCRHDKLPTILIEKFVDDFPDFVIGYVVAAADKHGVIPNMTFRSPFLQKKMIGVKKKSTRRIGHSSLIVGLSKALSGTLPSLKSGVLMHALNGNCGLLA